MKQLHLSALCLGCIAAMIRVSSHAAPNLTPYQPPGWSDKMVVSTITGTATNSPSFSTADTLYVDWAVVNNGDAATGGAFYNALYVDGVLKNFWLTSSSLNPGDYWSVTDYSIGSLTAGAHTITISNDAFAMVVESNENDNFHTRTITVTPPPNLAPHQPTGWSDKIVVSSVTGTTTNSPFLTTEDTLYVDWAVINKGGAPTASRFYTRLYVDYVERVSWYSDPPLPTNSHVYVTDYSLGQLSYGNHTLWLMTDSTSVIPESDEMDNSYTLLISVGNPPQPNLAPYAPAGWSGKVVVATNAGAITDSPSLTTADPLYVSCAVGNIGNGSVTNAFVTTLSVDGDVVKIWTNPPPLGAGNCVSNLGLSIGPLNAIFTHTITLATDTGSAVAESNEGDNSYIKLVAVLQAPPSTATLPASSISDVSAGLNAAIAAHLGAGYYWFEFGTNTSYGNKTANQSFAVNVTNVSATISSLTPETTYHYRVVAYNAGGTNYGGDVTFATGGPDIRIVPLTLTFTGSGSAAPSPIVEPAPGSGLGRARAETRPYLVSPIVETTPASRGQKLPHASEVLGGFATNATVKVIVNLEPAPAGSQGADRRSPDSARKARAWNRLAQQDVLADLPATHVKPRYRFDNLPAFSAEISPEGLAALQNHPRVRSIEPVYTLYPHLAQGIPLIHGMTYRSTYNGAGMAIAICDTGIDYHHPRLGGGGFPNSKVLGGYDFGDNDADPKSDGEAHGTCCAGIAAGDLGTVGDYIGGVAYNAKLYALKISPGSQGTASSDAEVAAIDWCVTHQNDNPNYPIMVISMSFGGGRFLSPCDDATPSMTAAAASAAAAGITVLMSSGNNGYCDAIAFPSCVSSVISVGAVYDAAFGQASWCVAAQSCAPKNASSGCTSGYVASDQSAADKVTVYANMADFVTLLAPGNQCYTTDILGSAGYDSGDYDPTFGGTSAACPYAAGAVACLQSAAKARSGNYLSPSEVRARLLASGDNITDTKVAITKPRINLQRAIESLADASQTFRIHNDGLGVLTVSSILAETTAPWISFVPTGPFQIPAAGYQDISVVARMSEAPAGQSTVRLLVNSSDADKTPYPGGVYVQTIRQIAPVLSDLTLSNGIVNFRIHGPTGCLAVVQASSNLTDWWPLCTNAIPAEGRLLAVDPGMTNQFRRFYRVWLP